MFYHSGMKNPRTWHVAVTLVFRVACLVVGILALRSGGLGMTLLYWCVTVSASLYILDVLIGIAKTWTIVRRDKLVVPEPSSAHGNLESYAR